MRISIVTMGLIALLAFSGCQKDDPPPTNTELISRNWKATATTGVFPAPIGTVDLFAQAQTCDKDNIIKVKADGTYTIDEGLTKCNSGDPQIKELGNWTFSSNETKVTIISGQTWDIVSLSATTLVLRQTTTAGGGLPSGTINLTLTAQ